MTNPDNVGGLFYPSGDDVDQMIELAIQCGIDNRGTSWPVTLCRLRAKVRAELCRAAPAGGDDWPFLEEMGRDGKPTGYWIRKGSPAAARMCAPAGSGEVGRTLADDIVKAVCDELRIGKQSRSKSVILTNVRNVIRRADCLGEVEREFFTENGFDDDGDEYAECPLPWGADADEYVKQFAVALLRKLQQGADGWRPIESAPKEDGLKILGASNAPWTQDYYPVLVYEGYRHGSNKQYFGWQAPFDHDDRAPDPTHWMPLPAPPASQGQEGGK